MPNNTLLSKTEGSGRSCGFISPIYTPQWQIWLGSSKKLPTPRHFIGSGDITDTRMHITGGLGAVHGIEGFTTFLPNADAFNETCAAVGNVLFNFRMFLAHKDAKYLDVAEVSLLNNVLAAVNPGGKQVLLCQPTRGGR